MADENTNPMTPSADYTAMCAYWDMVDAILGGAETMRAATHGRSEYIPGPVVPVNQLGELVTALQRSAVQTTWNESPYLPRFLKETSFDYEFRRRHAPFNNIYGSALDNLASKPFAKDCTLAENADAGLKKLSENIDGRGHNQHVFTADLFRRGLAKGIHWILIEHTKAAPGPTIAAEKSFGARPYWVSIPAERMKAVYSAFANGKETIYHARIYEPTTRPEGYGETCVERVRFLSRKPITDDLGTITGFGPAVWQLLEKTTNDKNEETWVLVDSGAFSIGEIPLVPFIPEGRVEMSWKVEPALRDLAYMNVDDFQQGSNLKTIKELTAFPMLTGNGVTRSPDGDPPVGPRTILYAPMNADGKAGSWGYIEPAAASLTFLKDDLVEFRKEEREAGRQPIASANLTVMTSANVSMRAHSAVQKWALKLKDSLEEAWRITCLWLKTDKQPEVIIHTDFDVELEAGQELDVLEKARAAGAISNRLWFGEAQRRDLISQDADFDEDQEQLATEQEGQQLQPEKMIDPVTGRPIVATPVHGVPNPPPVPPKPGQRPPLQ